MGSSRISRFAPDATRMASDRRRSSPPERTATSFSASAPENRNRPSSARALPGVRPVARCAASSAVPSRPISSACCDRKPELDVVAAAQLALLERAPAGERLDQRRLAGAVRPDQRRRARPARATAPRPRSACGRRRRSSRPPAPARRVRCAMRCRTRIAGPLPSRRVALQPLDLLAAASPSTAPAASGCPRGNASTNRSSRSISACWRSIARPSASSRAARSFRHACHGPAKKRALPGLQLQHGRADRLEEPAVVRDQHDRRVDGSQLLLEPLERRRRRGGSSARRAAAGPDPRPECGRASRASALRPENVRSGRSRSSSENPSPRTIVIACRRQS